MKRETFHDHHLVNKDPIIPAVSIPLLWLEEFVPYVDIFQHLFFGDREGTSEYPETNLHILSTLKNEDNRDKKNLVIC